MRTHEAVVISTTIDVPLASALAFAQEPRNFPRWAAGMSSSLRETDGGWIAQTPHGEALVRFSAPNPYGVLDHWVRLGNKQEIYIPLRMTANGDGTEVALVLYRQADMSDADFERDAGLVRRDFRTLKTLLEMRR